MDLDVCFSDTTPSLMWNRGNSHTAIVVEDQIIGKSQSCKTALRTVVDLFTCKLMLIQSAESLNTDGLNQPPMLDQNILKGSARIECRNQGHANVAIDLSYFVSA